VNVLDTPPGYVQFDENRLRRYVAELPDVRARLGGVAGDWAIREVGDGNLNLVFLVNGPQGGVCVKQSVPHIRAVKSWRLPLERTFFEYSYFRIVAPIAPGSTPSIYHYDPELFCMVMEQLSPHLVLRRGLVAGETYPRVARDIADYVARVCFYTSDLGRRFEAKLDAASIFTKNHALLRITTDLVFNDPYREVERNRWTTPQLDDIAVAFRSDGALKIAAARLGLAFLTNTQALIHGDLHSGSVMVTESDTRVIDPEFAFYGPIGFDLGAFVGNLLIGYLSQPGHATAPGTRTVVADWVLEQVPIFWDRFRTRFLELWQADAAGDAFAPEMFADASSRSALLAEQERYMDGLYADMIGFAAVKMIRRILGFAHVIDFEEITDRDKRATIERATLQLARNMLTEPERFDTTAKLVEAARMQAASAHI
jgi:5-methylthioribose kinase